MSAPALVECGSLPVPTCLEGPLAACASACSGDGEVSKALAALSDLTEAAAASPYLGLHEACALLGDAVSALAPRLAEDPETRGQLLAPWPGLVAAYLAAPGDAEACAALAVHLARAEWPTPLPAEDVALLAQYLLESGPGGTGVGDLPEPTPELEPAPKPAGPRWDGLPEPVREVLELLTLEAEALPEALAEVAALAAATESSRADRAEAVSLCAEHLDRFGGALEAGGLGGLKQAADQLLASLHRVGEQGHPEPQRLLSLVTAWCQAVSHCLLDPGEAAASRTLVDLLHDADWPVPLDPAAAAPLLEALSQPDLGVMTEPEGPARATEVRPEDISLTVPADVPTELSESLLEELPTHTASLSAAVQRLSRGGTLEDLNVAQRAAHTLKGAANTVGVAGIANLTHHMEDILLALAKHQALPGRALSDLLVQATDCLEAMGEALADAAPPPEDTRETLQTVLDWANRIDREGVTALAQEAAAPPPAHTVSETERALPTADHAPAPSVDGPPAAGPSQSQAASAPAESEAAPSVRVPAHLLDNLLRLIGETLLLTSQLQDRLSQSRQVARATRDQFALLQHLGSELEHLVDLRGATSGRLLLVKDDRFDPLELDQYNELHTLSRRIFEAATDAREMSRQVEDGLVGIDTLLVDQARLNRETHEALLRTRMVPVKSVFPRLQRAVRQAARATDKTIDLALGGAETLIDSEVLGRVVDPLLHVLRNAVDHGIETAEIRRARGKATTGRVSATFEREGSHVVIRCRDDGAGLDLEAVRARGESLGLVRPGEVVAEDELKRLILRPNFTTRGSATHVSGRGIGLDVVHRRVQELGGVLRIDSTPGQGCLVEVRIPLTLMAAHGLLVRVRRNVVGLVERGIEQIVHADDGEVVRLGDEIAYQTDHGRYPATSIETLLGMPEERRAAARAGRTALLVRSEGGLHAVLVQDLIDSRDLVVKGMGQYLPKLRGIVGATILGDGTVTPVLDVPELLRTPAAVALAEDTQALAGALAPSLPIALVVDDSLSARRSLVRLLEDWGYEVREARDGLEALDVLKAVRPDFAFVDLEMPRMNGLELTAHLRAQASTRDLPVIMVTSRSTLKHREQAATVGVDLYLTKPFVEDDLLRHLQQLARRAA